MTHPCPRHNQPRPCRDCAATRTPAIQAAYDALHHRTPTPTPRATQPTLDEDDQ